MNRTLAARGHRRTCRRAFAAYTPGCVGKRVVKRCVVTATDWYGALGVDSVEGAGEDSPSLRQCLKSEIFGGSLINLSKPKRHVWDLPSRGIVGASASPTIVGKHRVETSCVNFDATSPPKCPLYFLASDERTSTNGDGWVVCIEKSHLSRGRKKKLDMCTGYVEGIILLLNPHPTPSHPIPPHPRNARRNTCILYICEYPCNGYCNYGIGMLEFHQLLQGLNIKTDSKKSTIFHKLPFVKFNIN